MNRKKREAAAPLALVECGLLRADVRLAPLRHVAALFTQLLDISPLVSLPTAAAKGSVRLFDRVVARIMADASLDKALVDFWFARAMQSALERDDLAMLRRLHALHPAPLYVNVPVTPPIQYATPLGLAFQHGTLETIQWLVLHRADRACCSPGVQKYCRGCIFQALPCIGDRDAFRIAMWLFDSGVIRKTDAKTANRVLWRAMQQSPPLVRWLTERALVSPEAALAVLYQVIRERRAREAVALLDIIVEPLPIYTAEDQLLVASFSGLDEVVEKLIAQGHCNSFQHKFELGPATPGGPILVQWRPELMNERDRDGSHTVAGVCRRTASRCGNLLALQWLYKERSLRPHVRSLAGEVNDEATLLKIYVWMHAMGMHLPPLLMDEAAGKGHLKVVQWLHDHSSAGCTTNAMDRTACNGHLPVVRWLQANRTEGCTADAITAAATNGHLEIVRWLHRNRHEDDIEHLCIQHAAASGELDVLVWLTGTFPEASCRRCITAYVLDGTPMSLCRVKSIDVLRWNDAQPAVLCDYCRVVERRRSGAMISVTYEGDLEVVKYMYERHRDKVHFVDPGKTVRRVAQAGHLAVLQWIDETFGAARDDVDVDEQWNGDWAIACHEARTFGQYHIDAWIIFHADGA